MAGMSISCPVLLPNASDGLFGQVIATLHFHLVAKPAKLAVIYQRFDACFQDK